MSINKHIEQQSKSNQENNNAQNPRVTWEGCSVLLDINDGDRLAFARLTIGSALKIGNKQCPLQSLIGCAFGSLFQVENGKEGPFLSRIPSNSEGNDLQDQGDSQTVDVSKDNRALVDNNMAQSLTEVEIEELKRQGVSGSEIVGALIANSATFDKKTSFSQEKYRLKKQKKYAPRVLLRRPFARSICETYFKKNPEKIGWLRIDSLSLLLSMANVTANSDVLVVDLLGGMLTGAVAERLGGTGSVCNTHHGVSPYPIDIVRIFNFTDEICKRIVHASLSDLSVSGEHSVESNQPEDLCNATKQSNEDVVCDTSNDHSNSMEEIRITPEDEVLPEKPTSQDKQQPRKAVQAGQKATSEIMNLWRENGFSSLIVAAPNLDAWSIVKELLPLLSFSAPFAIYHQHSEPLAACMRNLQHEKMAIGLQIIEPYMREYQVLPSRTHPHMQMSAFGGYILSGIKICPFEKN
ncbi:translation initiation factor [Lithospermum erythrorhizon]|uniref:tRNA (adenine(58)-N(1))-methyltransferase non-catalytic subunit TRM6 n=1 Tax=Lithospermum erythrorhizon TaxID=34254 RepID=A0AAV3PIA2_LITER